MLNPRNRLRAARERKGLTVREVAEFLHYSPTTVYNWESGHYEPGPEAADKLAELYGYSVERLLWREGRDL